MDSIQEISTLLNARTKAILIETFEEFRLQYDLKNLCTTKGYEIFSWSLTSGLKDAIALEEVYYSRNGAQVRLHDAELLFRYIQDHDRKSVFLLKDFHDLWEQPKIKRALRDVLESEKKVYTPVIISAPVTSIPRELEKLISVVRYDLPSREDVIRQLEAMEENLRKKDLPTPEGREREAIIHSLVGMTNSEIVQVLKKSVTRNKRIDLNEVVKEKEQIIRKTGLLEYITKTEEMAHVGGADIIKDWFEDAYYAFDPEARKFNVDPVRGAILTGWPGCGKSLICKSVAHMWNLPLLKLNMSLIMSSRVGESEKNIDRALKLAEDVSPCVLWIDELEKGLAGLSSSDRSDSGTLSRVIQSLLSWLSEKEKPVFVIATANDITKLPPELTRAGRFDEIFFISIPHQKEREDILKIHLEKRGYAIDDTGNPGTFDPLTISDLAQSMSDFSGAEIEQVVSEAGRRAYAQYKKNQRTNHFITEEDLKTEIKKIIPLSKRDPELLEEMREWAKQSAKCASSEEHAFLFDEKTESLEEEATLFMMNDIDI